MGFCSHIREGYIVGVFEDFLALDGGSSLSSAWLAQYNYMSMYLASRADQLYTSKQ